MDEKCLKFGLTVQHCLQKMSTVAFFAMNDLSVWEAGAQ